MSGDVRNGASPVSAKMLPTSSALGVVESSPTETLQFPQLTAGAQLGSNLIIGKGRTDPLSKNARLSQGRSHLCVPVARPARCREMDGPRASGLFGVWAGHDGLRASAEAPRASAELR